jgi:lipopolysaccharide/colanic/teichoic acid biosynthesis glycosyltransferase
MNKSSEYRPQLMDEQAEQISFLLERRFYYLTKRAIDLIFSSLILVCLSPLIAIVAILIKLDSPGPVFFKQTRVGSCMYREGKRFFWKRVDFSVFKFRTMSVNTSDDVHKAYIKALIANDVKTMKEMEGDGTTIHKLVKDNRITRVGRVLRKLSLDEIPQFWNVIRGEMSVVGPRPSIPYEIEMLTARHLYRLNAKPGITGLQQVVARNSASFDEQIELDIQYIDQQSLWLDIQIMLKTPFAILFQRGA